MKLSQMIKELNGLQGETVKVFGSPVKIKHDEHLVDTCDILEALQEIEANDYQTKKILKLWDNGELEYNVGDNTYNYGGNITHHLNWYILEHDGKMWVIIKAHLYGDVRGNYTNEAVLMVSDGYEFYELLEENAYKTIVKAVNGEEYHLTACATSDDIEVYNTQGDYITTIYDIDDLETEIAKND